MNRLAFIVVALVLPFSFAACDVDEGTSTDAPTEYTSPADPGGIGMTYNGKMGYDMGGGFVVPFDGSGPSLGYGF